jgi:hypothetical protein
MSTQEKIKADKPELNSPREFSREEMERTLDQVLASKHFVHAPMKQKFLRLICDFHLNNHGSDLNEYLIGREVFDRDDSYNPATDPIVRVGAHGVREKLALYYQAEGANDEIRIEIPIGSYEPVFVRANNRNGSTGSTIPALKEENGKGVIDFAEAKTADGDIKPGSIGRWHMLMGMAIIALSVVVIYLLDSNRSLRQKAEVGVANRSAIELGAVWEPFLKNAEPTLLILSNPTVHRSANANDPVALLRKGINLTPQQASVLTDAAGGRLPVNEGRTAQLVPAFNMYTGIGEAIGAYRLASLLHSSGEPTILKQSRSIGTEDLRRQDAILLGSVYSNQWSKPLSIRENFVYSARGSLENLAPLPGEHREYKSVFDQTSGNLLEDYALITVTPGVSGERTVMVLAGLYSEGTEAATEYVTNKNYLNDLNQRLLQFGGGNAAPRYYQVLLKVKVENSFPTNISILAIRELHEKDK